VSLNGANRLGSNSLTECLVFGARAGRHAARAAQGLGAGSEAALRRQGEDEQARIDALRGRKRGGEKLSRIRTEMNGAMERGCGVYREEASMRATCEEMAQIKGRFADVALADASKVFNTELIAALELCNMLDVAEAIARCAHARQESRGAHTRTDFTKRDDQRFLHHSLCHFDPAGPRLSTKPVTLGHWTPEERKY
jgi:fumarate reductase flavoprotein subunit